MHLVLGTNMYHGLNLLADRQKTFVRLYNDANKFYRVPQSSNFRKVRMCHNFPLSVGI